MRTGSGRRSIRTLVSGFIGGVGACLLLLGPAPVALANAPDGSDGFDSAPLVHVETGVIRGARSAGVDSFLGIPYAQPPVGDLRWRPPQPALPWRGVRDTVAYGNRCPAVARTNGPRSETEDCLFLNVQRPANAH